MGDDPERAERRTKILRKFSLARTAFWIALVPVAYFTGWLKSVTFVSLLSLWALVETAFAAYRADENPDVGRIQEIGRRLEHIEQLLESRGGD